MEGPAELKSADLKPAARPRSAEDVPRPFAGVLLT